jgi:hypothetical protein
MSVYSTVYISSEEARLAIISHLCLATEQQLEKCLNIFTERKLLRVHVGPESQDDPLLRELLPV